MSRVCRNGKNGNLEKTHPGCLGKMVNLFDLNMGVAANRQLAHKPHWHGSSFTRSRSDATRMGPSGDPIEGKVELEFSRSISNRKSNGMLMKMLIAQEMSADWNSTHEQPNLVAKLMGLDTLPRQELSLPLRTQSRGNRSDSLMSFCKQKHISSNGHKEFYETWQQAQNNQQKVKGKHEKIINSERMGLVRQKFIEAKHLCMDGKLLQSEQFRDALEVLSSNKDLFLKCLEEPDLMFCQPHCSQMLVSPTREAKRITVLRPSMMLDSNAIGNQRKVHPGNSSPANSKCCEENCTEPMQIVVLKPNPGKPHNFTAASNQIRHNEVSFGDVEDVEDHELRDLNIITQQMHEKFGTCRRDGTSVSSVFANGYVGDESSFHKSEIDCTEDEVSDSEFMSPVSRISCDYGNRLGSPPSSSFSWASYSPESSVCREAKKRLSERWAVMASNTNRICQERSSSTLGEMLSFFEAKKALDPVEQGCSSEASKNENVGNSPRNLMRSKSLPVPSTESASDKSSFGWKVASLFSRNKKSDKDTSPASDPKNEFHLFSREICDDITGSLSGRTSNRALLVEQSSKASCSSQIGMQGLPFPKSGLISFEKPAASGNPVENQNQPSPISVFDAPFEEDEHTPKVFPHYAMPNEHSLGLPLSSIGSNVIDKSPLIGSIARTLSWDDSCENTDAPSHHARETLTIQGPHDEMQEFFLYVETLLSVAGLHGEVQSNSFLARCDLPENPLDLLFRDKYFDFEKKLDQSSQKLLFDSVNAALVDISRQIKPRGSSMLVDEVWARVKEMLSVNVRFMMDDLLDDISLVVREEVAGEWWINHFSSSEIDNLGNEMEEKLLEELLVDVKGNV